VKKTGAVLAFLFLSAFLSASTTIQGTLGNLGTGSAGHQASVRFWLRGCNGQPRVNGVALIAPTQGGVYYYDFNADNLGVISGTLYSTRDAAGTGNGDIECNGSKTSVWYGMQAFEFGKFGPEVPVHAKNGVTLDITNVTPISTNPVVTAPTGDSTYVRLDAGNGPGTGNLTFKKIEQVRYADQFAGADVCAKIQAAYTDLPSTGGVVDARAFQGTQSSCSSGLNFSGAKPVRLLLDRALIPLGTNQVLITANATTIEGAPSFNAADSGSQFTYTGSACAVDVGDGTNAIFNVGLSGIAVVASGGATSSGTACGMRFRNSRYARVLQPNVQGFAAGTGITFQGAGSNFDATNEIQMPFVWNNLTGIYTTGTAAGHANQLRIVGGFVICNNIANSQGIFFDSFSGLMQVIGTDVESCFYGIRNEGGDLTYISGSHTENIMAGGSHIRNQGTLLTELGHTYAGAQTHFSGSGTIQLRCDADLCQMPSAAFANLGSPPNGAQIFCTDCNATCTAGGSTGRMCFRENSAWTH
jgi:hypothetical protein